MKLFNKFVDRCDYLWTGDKETLTTMWTTIVLAVVLVSQVLVTGYVTFFK